MERCITYTDRMLYFCTDCPKPDFRGKTQCHAVWNNLLQCGLYRDADCTGFIWSRGTIIICRVSHSAPCDHVVLGIVFFSESEAKEEGKNWKKALLHPCVIAVFLGMIAMMRNIHLYPFMEKSIVALASCNTGMSMFLIGMILSELKWRDFADPMILLYTFIRLITIPAVVFVVCRLFGVSELVTRISVILAAMPAGGTTVILSEKYKNNFAFASGCVTVSTVMSLPSLLIWGIILR